MKALCFGLKTVFFVSCVNFDVTDVLRLSMNSMIGWRGKGQSRNIPHICKQKRIPEHVEWYKVRNHVWDLEECLFSGSGKIQ